MEFRARIYLIMKKKKQIEQREELISQYFTTPIWSTSIPEWVNNVNEACKPYLDEAHERHAEDVKKNKGDDFGLVYHSTNIQYDHKLETLANSSLVTSLSHSSGSELPMSCSKVGLSLI